MKSMTEPSTSLEQYVVVRSRGGRRSCWPVAREIPGGWTATSIVGTKDECLRAIRESATNRDPNHHVDHALKMSLMFFGDSETDTEGKKYHLLFESARFAEQNRFEGIWLPERHFTKFGCLYPSPSVLHAALAMETENLRLRAGSVVLPLNDPLRVAEQWSVVDNLSNGRVEVAFASGWHPDDFALMPDAYPCRRQRMLEGIEIVQTLWRGESVQRRNGAGESIRVRCYPTPVQEELPIWLTAAGNPDTFQLAGQRGFNVLTHLFHQDIGELREKILLYHEARREAGHEVRDGRIAVALHTFVAESLEDVHRDAGEPYCKFLKSNLGLLKKLAFSQGQSMDIESLTKAELDQTVHWLLKKFVGGRSLMGTVQSCAQTCRELAEIGVSEIACLLDFGPETERVLSALARLGDVNRLAAEMAVGEPS
jgi:natural product biosynthesis luciferase-like monooxygenase protein